MDLHVVLRPVRGPGVNWPSATNLSEDELCSGAGQLVRPGNCPGAPVMFYWAEFVREFRVITSRRQPASQPVSWEGQISDLRTDRTIISLFSRIVTSTQGLGPGEHETQSDWSESVLLCITDQISNWVHKRCTGCQHHLNFVLDLDFFVSFLPFETKKNPPFWCFMECLEPISWGLTVKRVKSHFIFILFASRY